MNSGEPHSASDFARRAGSDAPAKSKPALAAQTTPVVFVVDDDVSVRESLELLIRCAGWEVETFESAHHFLDRPPVLMPSCLILDIAMPGLNGLDLQKRIAADRANLPIIFITGHGDVPKTVQAIKAGAVEFLTKPLSGEVIVNAIANALERSRAAFDAEAQMISLRERYACLRRREREVMARVVTGMLNKQIAGELGISEVTVKVHRGNLMRKMEAASLADLVNMSARLGPARP
jgi:FixJ family two-component response regulator